MARDSTGFDPVVSHRAGLGEAAGRAFEAAEALAVRRLELALAEARGLAKSGLGFFVAGSIALAGWFYLVAGVINALARDYPRFAVELGVGAFHVVLAVALVAFLRRAAGKPSDRP